MEYDKYVIFVFKKNLWSENQNVIYIFTKLLNLFEVVFLSIKFFYVNNFCEAI